MKKPEVLAPAGGWECAKAAVENGADAIYFGVGRFNARVRADNFVADDLPKLMKFLHRRGVRGYVTFNTLIFSNELEEAEKELRKIIAAGVDAAIVQDVGIVRLIRKISPDFPVHASTQMTVSSAAGVRFARELGASLAVLSREVNIGELEQIVARGNANPAESLPLEMFVHGALCVAYSGQCLTSEALGGRSANRGECAQACRLPYELICDGEKVPLGARRYLLSPRDLAGVEMLPELMRLGVRSLKIEGRLKTPEYVASVTRVYRDSVDRIHEMITDGVPAETLSAFAKQLRERHAYALEMAFSRGLYTGWMRGINNRELVHARFGKKRGVFLGEVSGFGKDGVFVHLKAALKSGDGVVFDAGKPEEKEEGGYVYGVEKARGSGEVFVRFARAGIRWERVRRGDKLWKTSDPALTASIRETFAGDLPHWAREINMRVFAETGKPLRAECDDACGNTVSAEIGDALVPATNKPASDAWLREQFARLGGTGYFLDDWKSEISGSPLVPASVANKLRRALVEKLNAARENSVKWTISETKPVLSSPSDAGTENAADLSGVPDGSTLPRGRPECFPARLIPVVRELAQVEAALAFGAKTIYAEFENPRDYRIAAERVHAVPEAEFWAQPPRIFKQAADEAGILRVVRECGADGFLVRAHEHLYTFAGTRVRGDFSLNVANHLTADYYLRERNLERVTASYDMNLEQLCAMLERVPAPEKIEVTLHQHMPMFHMEHCVFCSFLSEGKDFRDCGRPCEKHVVRLRDRTGLEHLVKADAGCRNTVYNARAQTGAEFFDEIRSRGVRNFRIEFIDETPELMTEILGRYRDLLAGKIDGNALWRGLRLESKLGVTRGTLKG
ncbi:MAG: U32 family peptidase [Opitutales bacterium]|nr:U32 family peptidase [Opitutales bacterium]